MFTLTTREKDEMLTRRLEQFMDTQYKEKGILKFMERIYDKKMQLQGIDIIFDDENGIKYIDEKFAIDYRGKELKTYSFELYSENNFDGQGWFLNPDSATTHYLLLWFNSDEAIDTIYNYEACLISKEKIHKMLNDDGVNPYEALEEFRTYFSQHSESSVGMKFHTVINADGSSRKRMRYNDYTVTQSDQKEEAPINLLIPKKKLMAYADWVMKKCEVMNVDAEIARAKETFVKLPDNVSGYIDAKAISLLKTKGIVSGNMWLEFPSGEKKQMQIKNIPHETKIVTKNKATNQFVDIAVYDKHFGEWAQLVNGLDISYIGKTKVIPYKTYMKGIIQSGYVPVGFEHLDKMHNRLQNGNPFRKEDGEKIVSYGKYTGSSKVVIWYDEYIEKFVLKDNTYITTKHLCKIGNAPILSLSESMVSRLNKHFGNT